MAGAGGSVCLTSELDCLAGLSCLSEFLLCLTLIEFLRKPGIGGCAQEDGNALWCGMFLKAVTPLVTFSICAPSPLSLTSIRKHHSGNHTSFLHHHLLL